MTNRPLEEQVQEEEEVVVEVVEVVEEEVVLEVVEVVENLVPMSARREGDVR